MGRTWSAPNCLQCHSQVFDSTLYIGLGNTFIDFTANEKINSNNLTMLENVLKGTSPYEI